MSIRASFVKGIGYIAVAKYSGIVIGLVITSILARILTPSDFGMIAIATVFIVFFSLLSDMGIAPAIIQFKQLTKNDFSSIFGFTFWIGLLLALLFYWLSPKIALFYSEPKLISICRILSLQIFFVTLNIVPQTLLLREKKFNIVAIRNVIIQALCGILAVIWACNGGGIYALLVSPILGSGLALVVNVIYMKLRIRLTFSTAPIRCIFSYSVYQFLFNFVNYFGRNLDKIIIGKTISVSSLGYYEKSYRLMLLPIENINGVIAPVLHPYLSDCQNDLNKLHSLYNQMTKILITVGCLVSGSLFLCSRELILLVFGEQWEAAVPCFRILSLSVATQISTVSIGSFMQACNRTKLLFKLGLLNVVNAIIGLLIAAFIFGSIEAISVAFVITAFISAINSFYAIYHYCFHSKLNMLIHISVKPLIILVTFILITLLLNSISFGFESFTMSLILKLFICGIMCIFCYKYSDVNMRQIFTK